MAEVASAYVSLLPSAKGFGSKLSSEVGTETKGVAKKLGSGFGKMFALAGGALAAAGIGSFLKGSIEEAREAQKVGALTISTIKATGGAAKITAAQVGDLSGALSAKTGIDDEVIQSGANMLLTFKNIRNEAGAGNDIFNQTTGTLVDLAAAMGSEPKQAAIQLGKALNDPIKGVGALSRVGVTFTDQQKAQIKTLVESGNVMGAQKVILRELKGEFGGAAEAQATAGDKAKVAWGNFQETVGTLLLPALDDVLTGLTKVANYATDNIGPAFDTAKDKIGPVFSAVADVAKNIGGKLEGVAPELKKIADIAWGKLGSGVKALQGLTDVEFGKIDGKKLGTQLGTAISDALVSLGAFSKTLTVKFAELFAKVDWVGIGITLGKQVPALLLGLAAGILSFDLGSLLSGVADHWGTILIGIATIAFAPAKFLGPLTKLLTKIPFVGRFIAAGVTWLNEAGRAFGGKILSFIGDLGRSFGRGFGRLRIPGSGLVKAVLDAFKAIPGRVANFFKVLETRIGVWALDSFEAIGRGARGAMAGVARFVGSIPGRILSALGSLVRTLSPRGYELIAGFLRAAKDRYASVAAFLKEIPARLLGALGDLSSLFYNKGVELIAGLARGITAKMGEAINAVKSGLSKIKGLLPGSPIKWGPLKNWNQGGAGKRLMDLVAKGINEATPRTVKAAKDAFEKIADQLKSTRDKLRSTLDGLKGDFASLSSSVSDAFTGGLFDVSAVLDDEGNITKSVGQNFVDTLMGKKAELAGLLASFKTLKGWGLDPAFLSQLFASGNGALITELAGMGQTGATSAASLFGEVTDLGNQLGNAVASNDPVAKRIDETNKQLTEVNKQLAYLADDIGKALDGAAAKAHRTKKNRGKK